MPKGIHQGDRRRKRKQDFRCGANGSGTWDGIKQLACAVIHQAIEDVRDPRCKVNRRNSAIAFLQGKTRGIGNLSCRDFVCELADKPISSVARMCQPHGTTARRR